MMRPFRTLLGLAAAAALLSACTVTFIPGDVGGGVRAGVVATIGDELEAEYRRSGWDLDAKVEERGRDRVRVMLERDD